MREWVSTERAQRQPRCRRRPGKPSSQRLGRDIETEIVESFGCRHEAECAGANGRPLRERTPYGNRRVGAVGLATVPIRGSHGSRTRRRGYEEVLGRLEWLIVERPLQPRDLPPDFLLLEPSLLQLIFQLGKSLLLRIATDFELVRERP